MKKKGFTLIELLVVISIIAVLMSIMMPALSRAREMARRVNCQSNIRSTGVALSLFANANNDRIPEQYIEGYTYTTNPNPPIPTVGNARAWNSPIAFIGPTANPTPVQFGLLYRQGYVEEPKIFYCPSQPRITDYPIPYYYDFYTGSEYGEEVEWGTKLFKSPNGNMITRTSYNYWTLGQLINRKNTEKLNTKVRMSSLSNEPMIFDNCQHWDVLPHKKGPERPSGISTYFSDGHTSFASSDYLFSTDCFPRNVAYDQGPGNRMEYFNRILQELKRLQ